MIPSLHQSLAQGGLGEGLAPLCQIIGFGCLLVLILSALTLLACRARRRPNRAASITFSIALPLLLLCIAFLETGWPTHAWRHRTRAHLLQAVDAQTGTPLPIKCNLRTDLPEDPFITWSMGPPNPNRPDQVEVNSNVDLTLALTADGHEPQIVPITTSSPQRILIPLSRATTVPTTHPN